MASYDAKINVLLSGLRDLVLLEDRLAKIGSIVNTLNKTPIALNVGGRGKERDLSGQLSKEVNDYVREWVNGGKIIGKSINAVQQQQAAFNELLRETAMVQQDPAAKNAVNNLANAWAETTRAATAYDKKLNDIQRKALGLQPQAVRDFEVARRQTFVQNERRRREGQVTAAQDIVNTNVALLTTKTSWLQFFKDAADLANELSTRTKQVEAAASEAARSRLASEAQRRQERNTFLAGAPVSQFPIGPNPRSSRRGFEGDTSVERAESALRAKELQTQRALNLKFFAEEKAQVLELDRLRAASAQKQTQRVQAVGKAVQGSLSSAAIGGAFPLLFGQSPQAAVGGAIGGLLGGAGGGFAGSLLGTALGELEAAKARTKELSVELGLSSTQAQTLATAFELAGRNSQQLEAAVTNIQGLGLSTQETASAIKIAVELSKEYGGSVEKIAQSFADTLESGKVSISTLNKFTAQGIPIQDELAAKFGVSRTKLLEMAKDGQISVQQVTDALVKMGQEAEKTADKGKTGFDRFTAAVQGIAAAIASAAGALLKTLIPALDVVLTRLSNIITRATQAINLIADAQVGEASAALAKSGFSRGTLFANKGNIDDLTQGLKSLQPLSAKTKEQFDRIADVAQRYRVELQQYGGALGEYAVGTAQVELTRVTKELNAARKVVGAAARPDAITAITAPANIPPSGAGVGKSAADKAAEDAARLEQQIQERLRGLVREVELIDQIAGIKELQFQAEMEGNKELQIRLQGEERIIQIMQATAQALDGITDQRLKQNILAKAESELASARQETLFEMQRLDTERTKAFDAIIADLTLELKLKTATTEQEREQLRIAAERAKLEEQLKGLPQPQIDQITQLQAQVAAPLTAAQTIEQRIGKLKDEVAELTNIGNIAITVADGIGVAFSQAFQGLISGSMSAEEALGSFFKSVGDMFVSMAAEIIAKQMTMIILQTILKALGAVGGGGGGGGGFSGNAAGFGGSFDAGIPSIGNTTSFAGVFGRAGGGPTAAGTPYLVGERGPELFVPGSNGGVMSNNDLRSAMNNQGGGASGSPVLNMSFESTTIGGVEYVSRDQLEQAMAETRRSASRDGAQRGMTMTLDRIQNSSSTRRRVGI